MKKSRKFRGEIISTRTTVKLVYLYGNNAAEGVNNIKYANSYPVN